MASPAARDGPAWRVHIVGTAPLTTGPVLGTTGREMCLGIPARVVRVEGRRAVLDLRGKEIISDASMVTVSPGDYVVSYAGLIVQVLPPEEAQETLRLLEQAERDGLVS